MKIIFSAFLISILFSSCQPVSEKVVTKSPNVLLVMVDDMGWTDLGVYGSEISTPNIDKLANEGMLFSDFHTSISCSPTRSMLLSGTDNHLAGLGNMGELLADNQRGNPGYEGYLNENVVSLAEVLKESGYHTYMAGKWHLGHDLHNIPGARGFEKTLSLLYGGGSHFADMAGIMPAEDPVKYSMNGKFINDLPEDFYSSRSYTDYLIEAIRKNIADEKPFLGYLAFTSPHDPLHVPEPWLSKYKGKYNDGYEKLKENRFDKSIELGLLPSEVKMPEMHELVPSWEKLSAEEKAFEAKKMEVYAGMVENMDYHLGRMINFINDIGELENTIILFLSDNGSNPWNNTQYPGNDDGVYLSRFDNSLENLGNPTSHIAYGMGWASACSGPFDYFKMAVGEGGIRTPLIMAGPGIPKGEMHKQFVYVTDLMPTILDLLDIEKPDSYDGKEVLPMTGKSLTKVLSGEMESAYTPDEYICAEMMNGKWVRKGNYKAEKVVPPYGPDKWMLYDLSIDPGEINDISAQHADLLENMINAWEQYAEDVGVILMEE